MTTWNPITPTCTLPPLGVPVLVTLGHIFRPDDRAVVHAMLVSESPVRWASAATGTPMTAVVRPVLAWALTPEPYHG